MRLIPQVKQLVLTGGEFTLGEAESIHINNNSADLTGAATFLRERIKALTGIDIPLRIGDTEIPNTIILRHDQERSEEYRIIVARGSIILEGKSASALFWAIQTLLQIVTLKGQQIPCLQIYDYPISPSGFTMMLPGKVPELSTLKVLIEEALLQDKSASVICEHSFALGIYLEFGRQGSLTAEEILELDRTQGAFHIELVPRCPLLAIC